MGMRARAFQKAITGPPARMVYILRGPFFYLPAERRMKRKGPQEVP